MQQKAEDFYKKLTGYGFGRASAYFGELHGYKPDVLFNKIAEKIEILDVLFNHYKEELQTLKAELSIIEKNNNIPELTKEISNEYDETKDEIDLILDILSNEVRLMEQLKRRDNPESLYAIFITLLGDLTRIDPLASHHLEQLKKHINHLEKMIKQKEKELEKINNIILTQMENTPSHKIEEYNSEVGFLRKEIPDLKELKRKKERILLKFNDTEQIK